MPEPDAKAQAAARARLKRLAWLLDSSIALPGGFRIGLDGLIGLIPGLGDIVGALLSSYIVLEAARLRVGGSVLARMVLNVAVELFVGMVPVVGDLFDFAFKANERNVRLLEASLGPPEAVRATRRRSRWVLAGVILALLALPLLALGLLVAVVGLLVAALAG